MLKKILGIWVPVIILLAMIVRYQSIVLTGTEVHVLVQGYDPRDIFRGDYVMLSYPVNQRNGSVVTWAGYWKTIYVTPSMSGSEFVSISALSLERPASWLFFKARIVSTPQRSQKIYIEYSSGKIQTGFWYDSHNYEPFATGYQLWDKVQIVDYVRDDTTNFYIADRFQNSRNFSSDMRYLTGTITQAFPELTSLSLTYSTDKFFVKEWTGRPIEDSIRTGTVYAIWKVSSAGDIVVESLLADGKKIK